MREIAADFDVLPQTLSQRVNKGYSDHNTGAVRPQRSHLKKKVVWWTICIVCPSLTFPRSLV